MRDWRAEVEDGVTSAMTSSGIFFFIFLISFITFDLDVQMKSNKFVKICKIIIFLLNQLWECFEHFSKIIISKY